MSDPHSSVKTFYAEVIPLAGISAFCGFSAGSGTIPAGNAEESIAKCTGAFSLYLHIA